MKKRIRKIAWILAHIGVLLSVAYLVFFLIITVHTSRTQSSGADGKDVYLVQTMNERDFSIYNVGKALSEHSDPAHENLFIAADLVIPVLFLASGVLIQIAVVKKRRKQAIKPNLPIQSTDIRR